MYSLRKPVNHSMLRRCSKWNYCAPAIYMVTLTLYDRSRPLLGKVEPLLPPNIPPAQLQPQQILAEFHPSALGSAIIEHWKQISNYTPEIQPLYLQLMEEHLHALLRVMQTMKRPLGNAIGGFKTWCNQYYRKQTNFPQQLFSDGFQDTILFRDGQLERMFNYLRDNPRRWAVRQLFPDCFTTLHDIELADGTFAAYGNSFLLQKSDFHLIQVSRSVSEAEMSQKLDELHCALELGAVVVSACVSDGEKSLMREAMQCGASLIALKNNGFPPSYKPSGVFFDACAEGRLLMLAPKNWRYYPNTRHITREECCVLNELALRIAGGLPQTIQYHDPIPENLAALIRIAGF